MTDPISSPTPEVQAATPIESEPVNATPGTANQGGSDPNIAPSGEPETPQEPTEESFTEVDPNTLSAENQEAYKNMLTDYKRKTAALADTRRTGDVDRKDLEYRAGMFDQLQQDEDLVNYVNKRGQPQGPSQNNQAQAPVNTEGISEDEFSDAFTSKDKFVALVRRASEGNSKQLETELNETKVNLRVEKADRFVKEFRNRPEYSDFDALDKYKFITYQVAMNRPPPNASEKDWERLLTKAYQNAKSVRDDIYTKGYDAGLKRLGDKSNNYSETPTGGTPPVYQSGDPKSLSAAEAYDMAKRGIRVPQDW